MFYLIIVYSNRKFDIINLNDDTSDILTSEWNSDNSGGSHITHEDFFKKKREEDTGKKKLTWLDNPKFELIFYPKNKDANIEFEVYLSRSETIWVNEVAKSIINSMMGLYIFKRDIHNPGVTVDNCLNKDYIEFAPKTEIITKVLNEFNLECPHGYILMPTTYLAGIKGPFTIMVVCNEKFTLKPYELKKK